MRTKSGRFLGLGALGALGLSRVLLQLLSYTFKKFCFISNQKSAFCFWAFHVPIEMPCTNKTTFEKVMRERMETKEIPLTHKNDEEAPSTTITN